LLSVIAFRKLDGIRQRAMRLVEMNRGIYREFALNRGYKVPEYGTVAFPLVVDGTANAFCETLREKYETAVVPGAFFGTASHVRISLAAQPDVLREDLARLEAALSEQQAS
jgi:aspartate/methionine/tyrosine aminotransferase